MRYRGGGVGHKYMRAVEKKHENMTLERTHGKSQTKSSCSGEKPTAPNELDVLDNNPIQPGRLQGDSDESGDEDYVPPEMTITDDEDSTDCEDSLDSGSETADSEVDSEEIEGSDGGYESYGLADF